MTKLLHIALLVYSACAVASACQDGSLDLVKGTRCRRYAQCVNGSWHLKECKFGQLFDSNKLRCASITEVGRCNDVARCSEDRTYSHPGSTNLYFRCTNGRISVQVCGTGEIFDPHLQYCRFNDVFQHSALKRAKRNADEACEEGSKQRSGKSCRGYVECINGEEVKKSCPDCMNFDDKTLSCSYAFKTPCEEPTTTPEPTDPPTLPPVTTPEPTDPPTPPPVTTPEPTDPPTPPPVTTPEPTDPPTPPPVTTPEPTDPPTPPPVTTPEPTDRL
nr:mucin-2-like [Halyomorpha halys]